MRGETGELSESVSEPSDSVRDRSCFFIFIVSVRCAREVCMFADGAIEQRTKK